LGKFGTYMFSSVTGTGTVLLHALVLPPLCYLPPLPPPFIKFFGVSFHGLDLGSGPKPDPDYLKGIQIRSKSFRFYCSTTTTYGGTLFIAQKDFLWVLCTVRRQGSVWWCWMLLFCWRRAGTVSATRSGSVQSPG
jgi:hypothetical protein